ncbi:Lcl C-terminal domain-containing protein [Pigmentiphaga litoralis]|uniref:Lcl C-terminal domain-containing protein n=1 Tax=Pigmentiphaga litoralis TaxID=516702 RepID=A0A7Y9J122_9BURK|nr:DUF1566 domain-containing protein [Pigmentiphaga litoralis]NYE26681.1 hypothetical protein [Pigmentiphaga litoralis]NYE85909.1 hypothetical protein [Pigmentiphaga litoralis]
MRLSSPDLTMLSPSRARAARVLPASLLALATLGTLAACGGGGGESEPAPPVVTVSSAPVLEADGRIVFSVRLNEPSPKGVTLTYATADLATTLAAKAIAGYARGGAACGAGIDYVTSTGAVGFAPGASTGSITITTCNDSAFQANKRFNLTVSGGAAPVVAVATLVNDDTGGLNDTGITACVDAAGAATACPAAGLLGQDAQTGRDAIAVTNAAADGLAGFSYAKIGAAGEPLAATATAWSCVRDAVTGMLWQVEQSAPVAIPFSGVQARVDAANAARLCGVATWRVPDVAELSSLVNSGKTTGVAIDSSWFADTAAFGNQAASLYWSATTFPSDAQTAWVVDFSIGTIGVKNKAAGSGNNLALRLVSGAATTASSATPCTPGSATNAATDRFTDNGDGTITDKTTQLMWMQCSLGQSGAACATGASTAVSWASALGTAATVNANPSGLGKGYSDWRLPNRNELGSIVDRACSAPAINRAYFPGTGNASYWSSSPSQILTKAAWQLNFVDGDAAPGDTSGSRLVRMVRAGN